jgi:Rps23 Pro-64 3,4-dihydroxylase Tpa1-like proline 4-hydroxylase
MILDECKVKLHRDGYCEFNIEEFDIESLSVLEKIKYKSNDSEYLENFSLLRMDYNDGIEHIQFSKQYKSHKEANENKLEFVKKYNEKFVSQIWLYRNLQTGDDAFEKNMKVIFYKILKYFYNKDESTTTLGLQWTLYNDGCFLKDHNDGQGEEYQNTCAILIYLNEEWEENWGGNLLLRNTKHANDIFKKTTHKVIPTFGKVAIIDLETFDTSHAVEKVIGEHNRFTILSFAVSKEKREKN